MTVGVYVYLLDLYHDVSQPKSQVDREALVRNYGIASGSSSGSWTVGASRPSGTSISSQGWPRPTRTSRTDSKSWRPRSHRQCDLRTLSTPLRTSWRSRRKVGKAPRNP